MKSTKLALVAALLAVFAQAAAQDYAFKVLVNKGKNELKSGPNWQPVKVGASLKETDELKVPENAYIGLVHVSGKPYELKQSGKYKVVDLAAKVKTGGTSVLNKYTDFILSTNTAPKNPLAATGAVDRGAKQIRVFLPPAEQALVYGDKVYISWEDEAANRPYVVTFKSMFSEELLSREVNGNSLEVDLHDPALANEDNILVEVSSKANKGLRSVEYTIKRVSRADRERIKALQGEIAGATAEPTAINKYVEAGFYEKNNLLIDAIVAYQEAIKQEAAFKDDYSEFLVRNNLKKSAAKK